MTPADYDEAMDVAGRARHALAKIFDDVDVLLTLSAPGAAPKGLGSTGDARYNRLWTLMGVPCVNVPALIADGGLPVGVQVIARYGADAQALAAARFVSKRSSGDVTTEVRHGDSTQTDPHPSADYKNALAEVERLWGAKSGTAKGDRLDVLATLIDAYEAKHYPMDPPDPIEAIDSGWSSKA